VRAVRTIPFKPPVNAPYRRTTLTTRRKAALISWKVTRGRKAGRRVLADRRRYPLGSYVHGGGVYDV
jgi:hypothetical protein